MEPGLESRGMCVFCLDIQMFVLFEERGAINNRELIFIYVHCEIGFRLTPFFCYLVMCFNTDVEFSYLK